MEAKETNGDDAQQTMGPDRLLPTPRERLHQNIERLQALNNQLFWDQLKQAELLTVIELVGFKIQHLARQIQEGEDLGEAQVHACLPPPEPQQDRRISRELQPLPVTRAFVAARPIHESRPNLPLAIRATVISEVEVRIKVLVDESGRVVRIEPLGTTGPASDSLVSATEEVARQWRFAPAMRGNQPVESEVALTFRYTPKTGGN